MSEDGAGNGEAQPKPASKGGGGGGGFGGLVKRFPRKVLSLLSNLPLAIGEMFTVAALMALGMLLTPLSLSLSLYIYIYISTSFVIVNFEDGIILGRLEGQEKCF